MAALPLRRDTNETAAADPTVAATATSRSRPALALTLVQRRRRLPALLAGVAWSVVFVGLLATAVFHTQLAGRQLQLDQLDRQLSVERERFDDLRYQRAELRSPVRLAGAGAELGMSRGDVTSFVAVAPDALARQLAAAGPLADDAVQIVVKTDPLDQFRAVKSVSGSQP